MAAAGDTKSVVGGQPATFNTGAAGLRQSGPMQRHAKLQRKSLVPVGAGAARGRADGTRIANGNCMKQRAMCLRESRPNGNSNIDTPRLATLTGVAAIAAGAFARLAVLERDRRLTEEDQ